MSTMTPDQAKAILLAMPTIMLTADSIRNNLEYIDTDIGEQEDGRQRIQLDGYFTADELEALAMWMRDPDAVAGAS
ncbi:hypothetical protein G3N96_05110 [Burkholderia sp. Se-20373]|uniref:hypothetical protein n=1 Tax=Burkholderia sp. Se-20373 TaxID=2703898 RepID=UPI0019800582|nr:hypothetical protein [Burkholderia sp. Se-20373]MBN3744815.1 hypothetical protein [Burkholderia sp. Se-20373]